MNKTFFLKIMDIFIGKKQMNFLLQLCIHLLRATNLAFSLGLFHRWIDKRLNFAGHLSVVFQLHNFAGMQRCGVPPLPKSFEKLKGWTIIIFIGGGLHFS